MARHKHSGEQGKARKKGKDHQGYALLQGNAPEKLQDRGAPVRSFGKLNHSLTWGEIIAEEQNRTLPEGAVALPAVAQKPEDEQLEEDALPIAGVGEPAAEPAVGQPAAETGAVQAGNKGEEEAQPGQLEVEAGAEAPVVQPEAQLGAEAVGEKLPAAEEASEEEEAFEDEEASEDEETSDDEEAFEAAYQPPAVFYKHNDWERGEKGDEPERIRQKPYLEVVVETPNVGSREAMDANTDPGHTSAVLEFTAKTPSDEYRRARLHVGFHPRAGAGIGGMEEALLHRTDYPGEVQDDSGTLTSASVRRRFPIDKDKVKAALNVMDKYDSGMPYNLIYNNCTTFVANVAKQAAIPGVEGAFQETDWHFGLKAKAKLAFLQMFGRTMGAVKNKPAEMKALLQKRDFNAFDKMRLSGAELQRYLESRQQGRGGSMKFHGYSPSDVAENLLAMQDDKSALIVNKPELGKNGEKDENYWFQHAARMHMLGKLGNANMNGAAADGAKEALGLPAPQDFQRDIKKAATKWNYFSAWRREIRRKKGWSNPYGPQEVTETVRQMPEYLQDALEQYQVVRTARLGVSDEDQRESEDKLLDTLQTVQQQAETAADALQNTNAPEAFVSYWDKLKTAGMTAEQFKTSAAVTETDTEDAAKDAEEDAAENATESESEDEDEIWADDEDEKIDDAIPIDRMHELLARGWDDALVKAVQDKLAGSALAPFLHNSISDLLQRMYQKMDNHWLNGIQGKGLWEMSDGMVVFRLLPDKNRHKAYEGLLKSLRGSKGKEAMNTWKQKLDEFHSHQQAPDGNEAASDTNNTRPKTVEEAIEQHLHSISDTGAQTMLLGFALRKAAAARNIRNVEELYAQQRKAETVLQAEPKAEDLPAGMVPTDRAEQIKDAIRGALQDKPADEKLTAAEVRKELAHYGEAMKTALLGLFPEELIGGEDSAQALVERASAQLAEEILAQDSQAVDRTVFKAQARTKLAAQNQSGSIQQKWDDLCNQLGTAREQVPDAYKISIFQGSAASGKPQVAVSLRCKDPKNAKTMQEEMLKEQDKLRQTAQQLLLAAIDLLTTHGMYADGMIPVKAIFGALNTKKQLDDLFA